jgi:hypothetical protein
VSFAAIALCIASQRVFVVVVVYFVIDSVPKLLDTPSYTSTPPHVYIARCLVKHRMSSQRATSCGNRTKI